MGDPPATSDRSGTSPSARPPRRRSGVVIPHRAAWHQRLAARLAWALIRTIAATLRLRVEKPPGLFTRPGGPPVLFCIWHNRLALSLIAYERVVKGLEPSRRMAAMVSASRDGGLLARILELFDVEPVRGSSSRRGPQALLELTTWAERGLDLAITPDGPRGPCYRVQDGVIAVAQLTGMAIVPAAINLSRKFRLKSWDRFQIPAPFARGDLLLGEPIRIPREATDEEREALRQHVEKTLASMTRD